MATKTQTNLPNHEAQRTAGRGVAAGDLIAAAQSLAVQYAQARQALPQLPAAYQSARPWFILLGRLASQGEPLVLDPAIGLTSDGHVR